jgi:glutamine synthetase
MDRHLRFRHERHSARGKRIRRSDLLGVAKSGLMMPTSVFIMDPLGNCVEETGRLWETGDPDHQCHLLGRTLVPIPVGDGRHAQAVMVVDIKDELDPRAVLVDQVERFTRAGQTPVAAVELEFYVTRRSKNGAFALHTPEGLSDDPGRPLTFGFEEMDKLSPFIDDIYRVCEAQGLPVDAVMQESGPGQFEINLKHRADAVAAASTACSEARGEGGGASAPARRHVHGQAAPRLAGLGHARPPKPPRQIGTEPVCR